ncbi:MAG: AAA family ATPase [Spirochaetales bacterium]|nr:AAA family ATPase [Spirochaetales bacterium]
MYLSALEIEDFRNIGKLKLDFSEKVNLLSGPNGIGKSTILQAIQLALAGNPSSKDRKLENDIVPWGTRLKPKIRLSLYKSREKIYRIEKTFLKGECLLFLNDRKIAEGKEALEEILALLGLTRETLSLLDLLFVEQGKSLSLFEPKTPLTDDVKSLFKDILKENLYSSNALAFETNLKKEYEAVLSKRGGVKKNTLYEKLAAQEKDIRERLAEKAHDLAHMESLVRELEVLDSGISEENKRIQDYEKEKTALNARLKLFERLTIAGHAWEKTRKYEELLELKENLANIHAELRAVSAALLEKLAGEEQRIEQSLRFLKEKGKELDVLDRKVAAFTPVNKDDIAASDELTGKIRAMDAKLNSVKSSMQLVVGITPQKPFECRLKKDEEEYRPEVISGFREITDFTSLSLIRDNEYEMRINGSLKDVDIEAYKNAFTGYQKDLASILNKYGASDVKELKERASVYRDLVNERELAKSRLGSAGTEAEWVEKKRATAQRIGEIKKQLDDLVKGETAGDNPDTGRYSGATLADLNNACIKNNTLKGSYSERLNEILKDKKEEDLYGEYCEKKEVLESIKKELDNTGFPGLNREDTEKNLEKIERTLTRAGEKLIEKMKACENLKGKLTNAPRLAADKNKLETELNLLLPQVKQEKTRVFSMMLLDGVIQEQKKVLEEEIFKPFGEKIAERFEYLVGDRYRLTVNDGMELALEAKTLKEDYQAISVSPLSFGTQEQLSFLFRLAMAETLTDDSIKFMVLDDSFVNSDENRFKALSRIISEKSETVQFIIFTCRDSGYAADLASSNTIDLAQLM